MNGARDKLEEGVPSRWPSWTTRMDTSTARKGLSPLLNTTLDPIEERTKEAEVAYTEAKTKVTRITQLQNEFYDKHTFDENDPKFTEMKSLGDIKDLQVHTKILLDEVNRQQAQLRVEGGNQRMLRDNDRDRSDDQRLSLHGSQPRVQ